MMIKKTLRGFLTFILLLALYLFFWPVSIEPVVWNPAPSPGLESGAYQKNDLLNSLSTIATPSPAPEDVAVGPDGKFYAGLEDGRIIRTNPDGSEMEDFAQTGGRPLGLKFDAEGNLIIADGDKGLLSLDSKGKIAVLSTEQGGLAYKLCDDLDIAEDGKIYFSDASHKFSVRDKKAYPLESGPTGRLLVYDPKDKSTQLLLDSLYFANGIALSADGEYLLFAETLRYRVSRYYLQGPKKGQREVFVENLPGFPDGVSRDEQGIFWLAIVSPRNPLLDQTLPQPFWRKVIMRLPAFLSPEPEDYGMVLGLDEEGKLQYNFQSPDGKYGLITNVVPWEGKLLLGSLGESAIGIYEYP